MKILITGADGFIGTALARYLAGQHTVCTATRSDLDLIDWPQRSILDDTWFDAVIHCAAQGRDQSRSFDPQIAVNNLLIWNNLMARRKNFGLLINIATGAEFDIDTSISLAKESEIWTRTPRHSYGLSKNIIAKLCQQSQQCHNLRLFGCFDAAEPDTRPIQRCRQHLSGSRPFVITGDRPFDMVSARDLAQVVQAVLDGHIHDKDVNVVYNQKQTLSEILKIYSRMHDLDPELIEIGSTDHNHYTGDGSILDKYQLSLLGLERSLKEYA